MEDRCVFDVDLAGEKIPFADLGLENTTIEDESNASGYHIPEGSLIIYDPQNTTNNTVTREQISTVEIVPKILNNFSLPVKELINS